MAANISIQSLKSKCSEVVVNNLKKEEKSVSEIKSLIPENLFTQLEHIQNQTVNLTIYNWNNHNFCLGNKNFSINARLEKILTFITKKTLPDVWKTIYVDDLGWNRKYPNTRMWKTADPEKTLADYGFEPAENVKVLIDRK